MLNCIGEVTTRTGAHPAERAKFDIARRALDAWPRWPDHLAETADGVLREGHVPSMVMLPGPKSGRIATANFAAAPAALAASAKPLWTLFRADGAGP
ncbi:hypothetical protein ACFYOT_25180 [Saccharothrix saharensis]|uniref:hypothetical protein n=1 Tax=Saccharothrix saharensis TaxID=571190 RepID=UPI0036C3B345